MTGQDERQPARAANAAEEASGARATGDAALGDAADLADAPTAMTEAEERFAERVAADLERVLGEGVTVEDLEIRGEGPVSVRLTCLVDGQIRTIEAEADDLLAAYRMVIESAASIRLSAAWWQIVGPM